LVDNRPDRIDNRQEWRDHRQDRRQEIRDQINDHPIRDFWSDHPYWAGWRITRPYRWATWGALSGWFAYGWNDPVYYSYGDNVYYQGGDVYYGDQVYCSAEEYATQAQGIAASAPATTENDEWMSLGVFTITQDGQESGPTPHLYVQLVVNKQGVIAGTFSNTETNTEQEIEGAVDAKSQRAAWVVKDTKWPIMETGVQNLTQDSAPALVHFENGETQQWLLVHLDDPQGTAAPGNEP